MRMHLTVAALVAVGATIAVGMSSADARGYRYARTHVAVTDCVPLALNPPVVYPWADWGPFFKHRHPVDTIYAQCRLARATSTVSVLY